MNEVFQTDVLIVGAGPTGLMAANQLKRFNIDFIIIDTKAGPTLESRAIAVTSKSLEIYQQMGLIDEVMKEGARINSFNIYTGGKRRAKVTIKEIGKGISEYSFLLAYEQFKNEKLLYQNLQAQSQEVMWNTAFEKIVEFENRVEVQALQNGQPIVIKAKYLVGCDGAKSLIRHQLNFTFKGGTYENKFFVADTLIKWDIEYDKLIISPGNRNFCAFFPLHDKNAYRVLGTLPDDQKDNDHITFSEIEMTIKETIGVPLVFEKVNWFSIYKLHHRCVNTFSKGNVFLAGDSAHIHSPAGGQGMNTGLQDAYNLSWKLSMVLKGQANPSLLNTYNEERLPFARWLLKFTDRLFKVMTSDNWFVIMFRKHLVLRLAGIALRSSFLENMAFRTLSQTGYSYRNKSLAIHTTAQRLKFKAGDRLPFFIEPDGRSNYLEFTAPSFHLLHIADVKASDEQINNAIQQFQFSVQYVFNPIEGHWKNEGVKTPLFVLVRPDNYIMSVGDDWPVDVKI